jgi:hypothetical protein
MSFSHRFFRLGVDETDKGVCLVWKCPRCEVVRDFRLIRSKGNISVLGWQISRPLVMLDLKCSMCEFESRVDPSEESLLDQATEITKLLKKRTISAEEYEGRIRNLSAGFVQAFVALNESWKCSRCGEGNPLTFDTCWNCGMKSMTRPIDRIAEKPRPPIGGNAWE